jgi:hypothetical protein
MLVLPGGSSQRSTSCRGTRAGVVCVLGALMASCATGVDVRASVQLVEFSSEGVPTSDESLETTGDPAAPESGADGAQQPSTHEAEGAGAELPLAPSPMSAGDAEAPPEGGDPPGDEEPSSSPPAEQEPSGGAQPVPSGDVPPGVADPDVDDPDVDPGPITPPDPVPGRPTRDGPVSAAPTAPPSATDPGLDTVGPHARP